MTPKKNLEKKESKKHEGKWQQDKEKIEELTKLVKQVQADFENYKKRTERDQQGYIELGKVLVLKSVLPVLDSFDKALEHDNQLKPLYDQLMSRLEAVGLKPMQSVGEIFDPHKHNCVVEECGEQQKGVITDEITKGYMLDNYIIRHANVKICNGKKEEKNDNISQNTKDQSN